MPHPHRCSEVVPNYEKWEMCTFWWYHGLLQLIGKEAGKKGRSAFGVSGQEWVCHAPLGFGSEVFNHSDLSANAPLWSSKGKRSLNPKNTQVPEEFLGWSLFLGWYYFQGCESYQRSEGTYGKDLALRQSARARISLFYSLRALFSILYIAWHLSREGEDVSAQILA